MGNNNENADSSGDTPAQPTDKAASSGGPPDDKDALNDAGAVQEAPWDEGKEQGNVSSSGPITDDYADIINPGPTTLYEEFAGTGGIGSITDDGR